METSTLVSTFVAMFMALFRVFIVALLAGILVRKKVVTSEHIDALSALVITVFLPSLILSQNIKSFFPGAIPFWWVIPIVGMLTSFIPMFIGRMVYWKDFFQKKEMVALLSLQNMTYLVLPIGQVMFKEQFGTFSVYCFLFVLGGSIPLWSMGKFLLLPRTVAGARRLSDFVTVPLVANLGSILLILLGGRNLFPPLILDSVQLMGTAAVPAATFVLGATLGSIALTIWPNWKDLLRVLGIKFLLLPGLVLILLYFFDLKSKNILLGDLFLIQSAAAPATALILLTRKYRGDVQKVGSMMLIAYMVCMLALPFWYALWKTI